MTEQAAATVGLTFSYRDTRKPALRDVSFSLSPGEFVTITGRSGCGKSTLALALAGYIPHGHPGEFSGSVLVLGRDTRQYTPSELAGIVGLIQQDPEAQLCTLNVADEVAFGPENLCLSPAEVEERITWALGAVGAEDLRDRNLYTLSGGEKQKVAIAAMLAMKPDILILDEPTANLDPHGAQEIIGVISRLCQQEETAVVVIEHRLDQLLPVSDRLVLMSEGEIIADDIPERVLATNSRFVRELSVGYELVSVNHAEGTRPLGEPLLTVTNLAAAYEGKTIISDISFSLYPGEITALMGDNGSGKTTLLSALLGTTPTTAGEITLQDQDLSSVGVISRAKSLGLSLQNPNHQLLENTVYKEAALACLSLTGKVHEERLEQLLAEFSLSAYRDRVPFALSLGEKKRLTVVSVLLYQPAVLILDEPIMGQDREAVNTLFSALRRHTAQGGSVLMVCHDPGIVADYCDRILYLDNGKLVVDEPVPHAFTKLVELNREEYVPVSFKGGPADE